MHVFMNDCRKDYSTWFFKHWYRISTRPVPREQWLSMGSKNVSLWGFFTLPLHGYADDLILFMLDIHSLQRAISIFDEAFPNYSLCINRPVTEAIIQNHMPLHTIISLCNVLLHNSTEFKYLGSYISQNEPNSEINHHILVEYAKFATMTNLLQNTKIYLKTRVRFLSSFVCSRLK